MADFIEVINHRIRMCNAIYGTGDCTNCPLEKHHDGYPSSCDEWILDNPEKAQSLILKWAEEHPLPIYPTWSDWISATFPETSFRLSPCSFISRRGLRGTPDSPCIDDCDRNCVDCYMQHIPEHFAKKLHIKPINIKED